MALQVTPTGFLEEKKSPPQVGDIIAGHGMIVKVETITVQDFIVFAISGGIPLHGFDEILIDERFVTSSLDEDDAHDVEYGEDKAAVEDGQDDSLPCIIGGNVVVYWINKV